MKIQLTKKRIILLTSFISLTWAGCFVDIYKDVGEMCDFTGSKRGWREYPLGIRTSEFYHTSPLETFIQQSHPPQLEHRWVSYQGTARTTYGLGIRHGHGRPNALLTAPPQFLENFVRDSSPQEVKKFYDFLRTHELSNEDLDAEINKRVHKFLFPDMPL